MALHIAFIIVQILSEDPLSYCCTATGLLKTTLMLTHGFATVICNFTYGTLYQMGVILPAMCSYITFTRFAQAEHLVSRTLSRLSHNGGTSLHRCQVSVMTSLRTFYHFHAHCRRSVSSQNKVFGYLLFIALLFYSPPNAFMFVCLLLGRVNSASIPIIGGVTFSQMTYLFGVHQLAVHYPSRCHRVSKLLLKINARMHFSSDQCKEHLKLANTIQMLHTRHCYGINYSYGHSKAHLVNMNTFVKVSTQQFKSKTG